MLQHILIIVLPLAFSNIFHMFIVKHNIFRILNISIWKNAFGKNKTWRGLVVVPLFNALFLLLLNQIFQFELATPALLGFILGMAYILFELPNSFIKRRLGINSGESHPKYNLLFKVIDKVDSAFGVIIVYYYLENIDLKMAIVIFIIGAITHALFSQMLVVLNIKKTF